MNSLTVLYDERCGLCRWAKRWVEAQPKFLDVLLIAAGSDEARRRFPMLVPTGACEELIVVSDEGGVYRDGSAWVMVLYALENYREWSLRLGSPRLLPLARQAFHLLSTHRGALSRVFRLDYDDDTLEGTISASTPAACELALVPGRVLLDDPPGRGTLGHNTASSRLFTTRGHWRQHFSA